MDFLDGVCAESKDGSLSLDVRIDFRFYVDQGYCDFYSSGQSLKQVGVTISVLT